jgi:CubicO group peptidase (beta-lactamase class C family)
MRTRTPVAAAVVVVLVIAAVFAWRWKSAHRPPRPRAEVVAEIDGDLRERAAKGFAGVVLLEQDGKILLHKGYGLADRAGARPITIDTGFDIGSLVKPFTGAAILKLEGAGKLRRSDTLGRFFANVPPDKAAITVEQLLSHSSGLPDLIDRNSAPVRYSTEANNPDYELVSRDEIVRRAMAAKLLFEPGTKSEYSNLGYSLLGAIVEIASGQPYERFVNDTIFRPAGMTRTGYLLGGWTRAQLAGGYKRDRAWGTPLDHPWLADGPSWNLRANGGMLSTAGDLHRWLDALAHDAIFSPAEKAAFFGLCIHKNKRGARTMGVAGSNEIFNACYLWYVDEHRAVIALTSSDQWPAENMVPELARQMREMRETPTASRRSGGGSTA